MNKEKNINLIKTVYGIVMVLIFVSFCLKITGTDKFEVLKNRVIISLIFLIPGVISLKFKDTMFEIFYARNPLFAKVKINKEKLTENIIYFGNHTLATGAIILILALTLYFIK